MKKLGVFLGLLFVAIIALVIAFSKQESLVNFNYPTDATEEEKKVIDEMIKATEEAEEKSKDRDNSKELILELDEKYGTSELWSTQTEFGDLKFSETFTYDGSTSYKFIESDELTAQSIDVILINQSSEDTQAMFTSFSNVKDQTKQNCKDYNEIIKTNSLGHEIIYYRCSTRKEEYVYKTANWMIIFTKNNIGTNLIEVLEKEFK